MNIRNVQKKGLSILLILAMLIGTAPDLNAVFARGGDL